MSIFSDSEIQTGVRMLNRIMSLYAVVNVSYARGSWAFSNPYPQWPLLP
jgi:hypothetical protein